MPSHPLFADRNLERAELLHDRSERLAAFIRESIDDDGEIDLSEARAILRESEMIESEAGTLVSVTEEAVVRELVAAAILRPNDNGEIAPHLVDRAMAKGFTLLVPPADIETGPRAA